MEKEDGIGNGSDRLHTEEEEEEEAEEEHATRKRICRSLAVLRNKKLDNPWRKHDNIPL